MQNSSSEVTQRYRGCVGADSTSRDCTGSEHAGGMDITLAGCCVTSSISLATSWLIDSLPLTIHTLYSHHPQNGFTHEGWTLGTNGHRVYLIHQILVTLQLRVLAKHNLHSPQETVLLLPKHQRRIMPFYGSIQRLT